MPERYRAITWQNLATLAGPEGLGALGLVLDEHGQPLRTHAAAHELYRRMQGRRKTVLLGETRAGKTIAAAAALRAELELGNDQAQWVHACDLREPEAMGRALAASFLVLDDVGYELDGKTGGWLATERAPIRDFLARWESRSKARLIVTTAFGFDEMASDERGYGGAAAMRVYEGAETIRFRRT